VSQAKTWSSASTGSPWLAHQRAYAKKSRSIGAAAWVSHSNRLAAQVSQPAAGSGGGGSATRVWASANSRRAHATCDHGLPRSQPQGSHQTKSLEGQIGEGLDGRPVNLDNLS
jgi:hypothetical protein